MSHHSAILGALAGVLLAAWASPGVAAAAPAFEAFAATAWKGKIPAGWKLQTKRKYGLDPTDARYVFRSPKGNGELRVNLRRDRGGDFKALAAANFARLRQRISEPKIHVDSIVTEGKDTISVKVLEGLRVRNDFMRSYLFARVLVRKAVEKVLVTITLGTTGEKMEDFNALLEGVMNSFEYLNPKVPTFALPAKASVRKK